MSESEAHQKAVKYGMDELKQKGFRCFLLGRKIPDALAIKDGQLYALEALGARWKGKEKGWQTKFSRPQREKEFAYSRYDGLFFVKFKYPNAEKDADLEPKLERALSNRGEGA
jgi:hypothetical protein